MASVSHGTAGDRVELGALLVLLHDAANSWRTVQADYRVWRDEGRANAAFIAAAHERDASVTSYAFTNGDPVPSELEETVRIWRDGARFREEHRDGERDGSYAVADGPLWWIWDERRGAVSNQDDPSAGSSVGQELEVMLDPTPLLGSLCFHATGSSRVAGRPTVTAQATPRRQDSLHSAHIELHQLGTGAQLYELEVDQERGVLLAVTAIRAEQAFHRITALAIRLDEPIPAETFQFQPPKGEEIQASRHNHRLQHVTLSEAQDRAPFTVLMPERVPATWRVHCTFFEASERPPSPAQVSLSYRSEDGHESISISQSGSLHDKSPYQHLVASDRWTEEALAGTTIKVTKPGFGQPQALLERAGTSVLIVSDNLTVDQLATIASSLRPVRSVRSFS